MTGQHVILLYTTGMAAYGLWVITGKRAEHWKEGELFEDAPVLMYAIAMLILLLGWWILLPLDLADWARGKKS